MKNSIYYTLKYAFISCYMLTLFILIDIISAMNKGLEVTQITNISSDWFTLIAFISTILILWILLGVLEWVNYLHNSKQPEIFVVVRRYNAEIMYVSTSEEDCNNYLPPTDDNYIILPYKQFDAYVDTMNITIKTETN